MVEHFMAKMGKVCAKESLKNSKWKNANQLKKTTMRKNAKTLEITIKTCNS